MRIRLLAFLFLCPLFFTWSEANEVIGLRITPQVIEPDRSVSWEQPLIRSTTAGTPVVIKINADSLRIRITVTAFVRDQDVLLVVQGDVVQRDENGERRSSSLQSLRVPPGEPILFFPLGRGGTAEGRQMVVTIRADFAHD